MNERPHERPQQVPSKPLVYEMELREPKVVGFEFPAGEEIVNREFVTHERLEGVSNRTARLLQKSSEQLDELIYQIDEMAGFNRATISTNIAWIKAGCPSNEEPPNAILPIPDLCETRRARRSRR